jgi:uncharacterized protein (DUF433 family)
MPITGIATDTSSSLCRARLRIRLQDILELYESGQSSEQILADFPDL